MNQQILVVEDEPDIALMIKLDLEMHGYSVITAGNGVDAIRLLAAQPVDAVLLDLRIPRLNGWEVLKHIREVPPPRHPVVIILSAHAAPSLADEAFALGCQDYVVKPFKLVDLRERLAAALRSRTE